MTGTNITVLDNFFYNIEKNIFFYNSSTVTKRLVEKGAAWLNLKIKQNKKTQTQLQTNRKWIHGPHFNSFSFCLDPPSSQRDLPSLPPHPCPIPSRKQWHSWGVGEGSNGVHSTDDWELDSIYRETGSYVALHMLRVDSGTVWKSAFLSNTLNWESQLRSIKKPNKPVHLKKCNA